MPFSPRSQDLAAKPPVSYDTRWQGERLVMMNEPPEATFGDLLRRYRLAAGLTQEGLAERAQVSPRAISDLERGQRTRPWRDTVQLLASA